MVTINTCIAAPLPPTTPIARGLRDQDINSIVACLNSMVASAGASGFNPAPRVYLGVDDQKLTIDMGRFRYQFAPEEFKNLIEAAQQARNLGYNVELIHVNVASGSNRLASLQDIDLSGLTFTDATLMNVDLTGANLQGTSFVNSNFQRANLSQARLGGMHAVDSDFYGANFEYANFTSSSPGAAQQKALFEMCDLGGASFRGAIFPTHELLFFRNYMTGVDFTDAEMNPSTMNPSTMNPSTRPWRDFATMIGSNGENTWTRESLTLPDGTKPLPQSYPPW